MVKAVVSLNLCFHRYNCWSLNLGKKCCLCGPSGAPASCPSFFSGIVVVPLMSCCLPVLILFFQGQGMLPYFANFRLLAEFSTPCVNQRWFFEVLGYPKSSRPNMANGVAMAVVFFLVRIGVMPVYYSRMYAVYGTEAFYLVPWGGRVAWICSSICLDIMNIMWMHKIARGCYKVLRSAHRRKAGAPQENGKTD